MKLAVLSATICTLCALSSATHAAPPPAAAPPTPVVLVTPLNASAQSGQTVQFRDEHHCRYDGVLARDQGLAGTQVLWDRWAISVNRRTCTGADGAVRAEDVRLAVALSASPATHPIDAGEHVTLMGYKSGPPFASPGADAWTGALIKALEAASQPAH